MDSQGSATVFRRAGNNWNELTTLIASDGIGSDGFGYAIGNDGGSIVVGAPFDSTLDSARGAAYVFSIEQVTCAGLAVTVNVANGDVPTDGDDVILGTDGPDVINAGAGRDVISVSYTHLTLPTILLV